MLFRLSHASLEIAERWGARILAGLEYERIDAAGVLRLKGHVANDGLVAELAIKLAVPSGHNLVA